METKAESAASASAPFVPKSLGVKVGILLAVAGMVAVALVAYVIHARGMFEQTEQVILVIDNSDGVSQGMDLTFAGFPIGRVRSVSLADDGKARIDVAVPRDNMKWLHTTTQFVLEINLVGGAKLRAFTTDFRGAQLTDGAVVNPKNVLRGDANAEIPQMVAALKTVLNNVDRITDSDSSLERSLANLHTVTERMAGKQGVLGAALGGEDNAKKLMQTIDRANTLLASLNGVSLRLDGVLSKTDQRVLGPGGVVDETQKAVVQANVILEQVRASLQRVDGILNDAQATAGNMKAATTDLGALRAEVEASLRKVSALIDEINRKWPFGRDTKIKLP
jgi:phospholipid/cholesterol/gamma-HCH transport system substrate-binding protein